MGMPRSVGDFFTWLPTLTQELQLTIGGRKVILEFVAAQSEITSCSRFGFLAVAKQSKNAAVVNVRITAQICI
jgi:hypothetical protein